MANNKILTRDNLAKRRIMEDGSCLFCDEKETVHHLFFECCVAKQICRCAMIFLGNNLRVILNRWQSSGCMIRDLKV
jgi:hypothetical protein